MPAKVVIGNGLRLCERCQANKAGDYGWFNDRCCVARHTLTLSDELQEAKFERFAERYGPEAVKQLLDDVIAIGQWQAMNGIKP